MIKKIAIWDLDLTVIDSSHRQCFLPDGRLDLDHWRENTTREKIFADSLLPLADIMREQYYNQPDTVVCVLTSRVMTRHDFDFLAFHDLYSDILISRVHESVTFGCGELKRGQIIQLARQFSIPSREFYRFTVYDDNLSVLRESEKLGCCVVDSIEANKRLLQGVSANVKKALLYND